MFCQHCGAEIADGSKYCDKCGAKVSKTVEGVVNDVEGAFNRADEQFAGAVQDVKNDYNNRNDYNGGERLKTDRGLLSYVLLSIITCGIYGYYFVYKMAHDINIACEGDGETTGGMVAYILLSIVTCGIYSLIWEYRLGNRLSANAVRYGLSFQENGTTVLLWYIFGVVICGIGPFVAMHILIKNSNAICMAYNRDHGLV